MIINFSKTKEIVFYWPNPRHFLQPLPLDDIDQVHEAKLLGVIINRRLCFDSHIQYILRQCSQRIYLLKLLRKQGFPPKQLNAVFQAIIISRIQYAISAWGSFIHGDWIHKIEAFLTRAHHSGLCQDATFNSLLFAADQTLFQAISKSSHCLHSILPDNREVQYELRNHGQEIRLPTYKARLHKLSFFVASPPPNGLKSAV